MTPIVEARSLTKRFGDVQALAGLDLVAESGHVTAVLGPNGAGKTTFISAVATLLRPDSGELLVDGIDARSEPARIRRVIGLAGQSASVWSARIPAACAGGSISARAWSAARGCSCSTNRPPALTRAAAPSCGPRFAPS